MDSDSDSDQKKTIQRRNLPAKSHAGMPTGSALFLGSRCLGGGSAVALALLVEEVDDGYVVDAHGWLWLVDGEEEGWDVFLELHCGVCCWVFDLWVVR